MRDFYFQIQNLNKLFKAIFLAVLLIARMIGHIFYRK